ncbi:MAG: HutD family protein [Alphaproteobacteria bacterium]|nr:HutD family protein [Alphaproteobacteria bacterium]
MSRVTTLSPADYRRIPWKNGGGVTVDIAFDGDVWRFSRTPITAAGAFSDYTGYDRLQVLIVGSGLVLETPDGEIDLRQPFRPVRFAGETPIASRLEAGPVEVVNLLGDRARVRLDLAVMIAGDTQRLGAGLHLAYCPAGQSVLRLSGKDHELAADEALRIEHGEGALATLVAGQVIRGSVTCVSR